MGASPLSPDKLCASTEGTGYVRSGQNVNAGGAFELQTVGTILYLCGSSQSAQKWTILRYCEVGVIVIFTFLCLTCLFGLLLIRQKTDCLS